MVYGPRGFFIEHIELDLCEEFHVNRTHRVGGMAFKTFAVSYSTTIRLNCIIFVGKTDHMSISYGDNLYVSSSFQPPVT